MSTVPLFSIVDANGVVLGSAGSNPLATSPAAPAAVYSEAAQSRTTNGTTTSQAWPTTVSQAIVSTTVTTFTGGTNVVVALQQQDANGNWVTIGAGNAITATGSTAFSVGAGMTTANMINAGGLYRLAWTLTGTFSALAFQISVQAR